MSGKSILIVGMGGTFGMVRGEDGMRPPKNSTEYKNSLSDLLKDYTGELTFDFACLSTVDSNNICPEALEEFAAYIRACEGHWDAIVVTHGTDTLANTASALNVLFQGDTGSVLNTPIVLTAAQKSINEKRSDGPNNLYDAIMVADQLSGKKDGKIYPTIVVTFGNKVINAAHTLKIQISAYVAFEPVAKEGNLGEITSSDTESVEWTAYFDRIKGMNHAQREARLIAMEDKPLPNGRLMISPLIKLPKGGARPIPGGSFTHIADVRTLGSPDSYIPQMAMPNCLGMIFILTGAGNTGEMHYDVLTKNVNNYKLPVCGTTDIQGGKINMGAYEAGSDAHKSGICAGANISRAMTEAKLAWLLANKSSTTVDRVLKRMSMPFDLSNLFRVSATPFKIPDIYMGEAKDANAFPLRMQNLISIMNVYRREKTKRLQNDPRTGFRFLSIEPEQAEYIAGFLPPPVNDLILPAHKNFDIVEATGWTHP
jgi:L-asparaginase/Glu-tRNA(Gln) amidotransferase subunit D